MLGDVERLDADPVASEHEAVRASRPTARTRTCRRAARRRRRPPPRRQCAITSTSERVRRSCPRASSSRLQRRRVVDLPVAHHLHGAVLVAERLHGRRRRRRWTAAACRARPRPATYSPNVVRSAMHHHVAHRSHALGARQGAPISGQLSGIPHMLLGRQPLSLERRGELATGASRGLTPIRGSWYTDPRRAGGRLAATSRRRRKPWRRSTSTASVEK